MKRGLTQYFMDKAHLRIFRSLIAIAPAKTSAASTDLTGFLVFVSYVRAYKTTFVLLQGQSEIQQRSKLNNDLLSNWH